MKCSESTFQIVASNHDLSIGRNKELLSLMSAAQALQTYEECPFSVCPFSLVQNRTTVLQFLQDAEFHHVLNRLHASVKRDKVRLTGGED